MSPTMKNTSLSRPRKASTQRQSLKARKPQASKPRKIPKSLRGVPFENYGVKLNEFYSIQPLVVSEFESAPSSLHTTPQDTVNLASSESYFPPADVVHSQIQASAQVYLGADSEPSHIPMPFQYDLDDIFSLTNNPCQSCGRYDPCSHFLPPSNSTGRLSMEHSVEPYQQWLGLQVDPNTQIFPPPNLSYVSNASSTFSGNSHNGIYAGSSHFTMASANDGTENTLHFPTYSDDANNLQYDSHYM